MNKNIEGLDLSPLEYQVLKDGKNSPEDLDEYFYLYKLFLDLKLKYPTEKIVPPREVDTIWHCHILDTVKYFDDCNNIFGKYIHHHPELHRASPKEVEYLMNNTLKLIKKHYPELIESE